MLDREDIDTLCLANIDSGEKVEINVAQDAQDFHARWKIEYDGNFKDKIKVTLEEYGYGNRGLPWKVEEPFPQMEGFGNHANQTNWVKLSKTIDAKNSIIEEGSLHDTTIEDIDFILELVRDKYFNSNIHESDKYGPDDYEFFSKGDWSYENYNSFDHSRPLFEETVEIKWFDKKNNFSEWFRGTSFIVADCFYDDYDKYSFFNYFSKIGIESDRFVLPFLNVAPDILGIQLRLKGIKPLIHFKIPQYELHCLMEKINAEHHVSKNYVFPTLNHRLIVVHIDDILQIIVTHQQDGGYGEECFENKLWMNKDYQILYRGEKIMIDEYMEDEAFGSPLLMDTFIFHNIQWKFLGDDVFENEFWEEYSKNLLMVEKYDGPTSFTYEYLMLNNATYFCTDIRFLRAEQYKIIPYHYNKWLETEKSTQFLNLDNEKVDESGKPIKLDNNENQNDEPNISDEEG